MVVDYEYFKKEIFRITGVDLSSYKEKQMKRRIDTLITKHKIVGYDNYVAALRQDNNLFEEFLGYITINVSEFYRNPEQWEILDKEIFPDLIKKFGHNLKVWSAACSTGDEPYSLVMALSKHIPLNQITVYATDLDKQILAKAKTGLYSAHSIEGVPDEFKRKYFTPVGSSFKIDDAIKARVEFKQHNLLSDPYPNGYHLIVCRNVLIYFTEEAKDTVFEKFYNTLQKGGVLFIGSTEQITDYRKLGFERGRSFFYQKPQI